MCRFDGLVFESEFEVEECELAQSLLTVTSVNSTVTIDKAEVATTDRLPSSARTPVTPLCGVEPQQTEERPMLSAAPGSAQ